MLCITCNYNMIGQLSPGAFSQQHLSSAPAAFYCEIKPLDVLFKEEISSLGLASNASLSLETCIHPVAASQEVINTNM